jgi:PmbA protein
MKKIIKTCQDKLSIKGVKEYETYAIKAKKTIIQVKEGKIDFLNIAETKGLSLRVINKSRLGFSYTTDFKENTLDYIINQALAGSKLTSADPFLLFPPRVHSYPELEIYDKEIKKKDISKKKEFALEMERAANNYDARIKRVRQVQFQEVEAKIYINNHNGLEAEYERSLFSGSITVMAEEEGEGEMGWYYAFNPFFSKLNPKKIGIKAASLAVGALGAKPIATQKINVIFTNRVLSEILGVLSSAFLADEVQKGKSLLAPHLGRSLISSLITIYDDGLYPEGYATKLFDDEGVAQQKKTLVENGVIKGFLYDSYTAAKENRPSTGNAGRISLETSPKVEVTNFYLRPLSTSFSELLMSLYKGVVVTDVLGIHTANPISGDFSVGIAGYWVEKGEKAFSVKGIAMAGNIIDLFKNVIAIGDDLEFYGHFGAPSVLVEGVQIGGY